MKSNITYGEKYGPAMEIKTQKEADEYFKDLCDHCVTNSGLSLEEAQRIERSNLGYYAGYYSDETRARVERLFSCAHPIFGSISQNGSPTAKEAFEAGVRLSKK